MNITSPSSNQTQTDKEIQRAEQAAALRFLDSLQTTLVACRDEAAVCATAAQRIAAEFDSIVFLASFDPIAGRFEDACGTGAPVQTHEDQMREAVMLRRTISIDNKVFAPVVFPDGLYGEKQGDSPKEERHVWGVLVLERRAPSAPTFGKVDRQTIRAAAARIAAELERRDGQLLDRVLDTLLRKAKPIDVYTHALREIRRFVPYDFGASIVTMQRGIAQITVRAEKVVGRRGDRETLHDGPRRGRVVLLTAEESEWLSGQERPFVLLKENDTFRLVRAEAGTVNAGDLWRVLGVDDGSSEAAVLCCPLVFGGQMLGLLRMVATRASAFHPVEQYGHLLERFSRLLSVTLYRSELYHQSDRQLQAIKEIGRAMTEPISVEEICERVLQLALRVLRVEVGVVGLVNVEGEVELVAHRGCTLPQTPELEIDEGIAGTVLRSGRSRAVPDVSQDPDYVVFNARVRSELIAPIAYDREVIGFLAVESFEIGRFREEDEEVITFVEAVANQAAIAIKTAQLRKEAMRRLGPSVSIDPTLSSAGFQDLLIVELRNKIEQLGAANERLASANQAKSEFLARMSHDLRGPLNVIVGLANLLTDPKVGPGLTVEKQAESLRVIQSSGEVLSSLIGDILDLSALEAGKVELIRTTVDAAAAFSYLQSMAATLAAEQRRELSFSFSLDPAITAIWVDEQKFMRIMMNLLSNAIKFTPSGGAVQISAIPDGASDSLHLVVSDSGVGIEAEHLDDIFAPFRRIDSTHGGPKGTGLGLAVVRQLADLHDGRVWVESRLGAGSDFHVHLPGALLHPEEVLSVKVEPPKVTAPYTFPGSRDKGLVLVVEDTQAHMDLMRLAVTSRGYRMHGVQSGEDAMVWLETNRPDVILLDMQLPGVDGFSVAAKIKGSVELNAIPLVAVTASAFVDNEERALASGCDAYLTKPIDLAKLLATIDTVMA
ncbi:MAG TPA: ATP-binding protein [Chloroflexota bacterium]